MIPSADEYSCVVDTRQWTKCTLDAMHLTHWRVWRPRHDWSGEIL